MDEPLSEELAGLQDLLRLQQSLPSPAMCRALRVSAGLSTTAVATPVGVTRQTVSKWERGVRKPRGEHLRKYVAVLSTLRDAQHVVIQRAAA